MALARWGDEDDVQLLQRGSAVALIVELIDTWDQANGDGVERYAGALKAKRFDHLPAARAAIEAGLQGTDPRAFSVCAKTVYERYVLDFFRELAAG